MPELPDVELYLHALAPRIAGEPLERVRLRSPFLVRSVEPPLSAAEGRRVVGLRRLGKQIVWEMEGELFLVFHLMITGRFRWRPPGAKVPGRKGLAAFDFSGGTLLLTEMGSKKRASLHVVRGEAALAGHDPGGLEVLGADLETFRRAITAENRTLKRALTDPRILSGIGNAWSDEILHAARLSPFKRTGDLDGEETERLLEAAVRVLEDWTARLVREAGDAFPEKVTAFRDGFAVHGKYDQPCPACGTPVQRILYAENEANYCPTCQTGGKLLADRVLSRLMRDDWPKTLEELEERKER
ncbi:MAG: DNA-formamidopyrimidine glycosylase family protein [Acidobacteriota bacterium]|jgi:formamidopyrimidine-DNA glycosylase